MEGSYDVVLLDVEGTTTPISFVHDKLFPYVTREIDGFLDAQWAEPELQRHVQAIAEQANRDIAAGIESAVAIDLVGDTAAEQRRKVAANVRWQMASDRKVGALKGLQGYMWRFGYEKGDLRGVVYADAVEAIKRWVRQKHRVYIYSSGSVEAQKLIFGFSDHGDLREYISGYYDTGVGSKLEQASYTAIAQDIGVDPERVLFISDNVGELEAANGAGMQVVFADGKIDEFVLSNKAGTEVYVTTWGARLTRFIVKDKAGKARDIVAGFESYEKWQESLAISDPYFGATVGRVAGRISPSDSVKVGNQVAGTCLDFTGGGRRFGDGLDSFDRGTLRGYDHIFVVGEEAVAPVVREVARVSSLQSGLTLVVLSNQPALVVYTGNWISDRLVGKNRVRYGNHAAVALEAQRFPNAVNIPRFRSQTAVTPDKPFLHHTVYRVDVLL
ncbi:enolase-phosphatase E1 [Coemansia sp. RSA 552]|nr:enolase-phosphatase E1 [Coemansia sp. RSA 552]